MLGPRIQSQLSRTCLRQRPIWHIAIQLRRPVRRYVSTHDLDRDTHTGNFNQVTQAIHGDARGARTIRPDAQDPQCRIRVRIPNGEIIWRRVKRSYPNGKGLVFMRELESLVTHSELPDSNVTSEKGTDGLSDTAETSSRKIAVDKERRASKCDIPDLVRPRWKLASSNDFISRTVRVVKEQYPRLLEAIEKEANHLKHHPHILGYELDGHYIVNILCTTHRPAGLSLKDTKLAMHINSLVDQLEKPAPLINRRRVRCVIRKLWERNTKAAKRRTKESQMDSIATTSNSLKSVFADSSESERKSPEASELPGQEGHTHSPILSVESTISPIMVRRLGNSLSKPVKIRKTSSPKPVGRRRTSLPSPVGTAPTNTPTKLAGRFGSTNSPELIRKVVPNPLRKHRPITLPKPVGNLTPTALRIRKYIPHKMIPAPLRTTRSLQKLPIIKDPYSNKPDQINNRKPSAARRATSRIRRLKLIDPTSDPETFKKIDSSKEILLSDTTKPNFIPFAVRPIPSGPGLVRRTIGGEPIEPSIRKQPVGQQPLTPADILKGTKPGSRYEKELKDKWEHLFSD